MSNIVIVTDSTCDLSKELIEKYQLEIVPLYVNIDNKVYKDGVDMDASQMYQMAKDTNSHPRTSSASTQDFYDKFIELLNNGKEIIYSGIGADLSCTLQNAYLVRTMIEEKHPEHAGKIHLLDSKSLSTGIGLVVIRMAEAVKAGKTAQEVLEIGKDVAQRTVAQFCVPSLDYIYKGGRCSNAQKFFGTILQIKPMLKVTDGKLNVWKKSVGSYKKALGVMIDEFLTHFNEIEKDYVFITHSLGDEVANYIKEKIQNVSGEIENLVETKAGCVISSHCGENTIGILYTMKK